MGANNSTADKQSGKHKRKSKTPSPDAIRGQRHAKPDNEEPADYTLNSDVTMSDQAGADDDNMLFDNNMPLGAEGTANRISIHIENRTPSPEQRFGGGQSSHSRTSPVLSASRQLDTGSTGNLSYHSSGGGITTSDDEKERSPQLRRSVPDTSTNNMNTIKQAKVNVRDKISFLEVSNSPVIAVADRSSKLPTHKSAGSDNQLIEKTHKLSGSDYSHADLNNTDNSTGDSQLLRESLDNILNDTRQSDGATHKNEPVIDYDMENDGGWTDDGKRLNTLEYFRHVPRQNSILKGFEKAKPAARGKRGRPGGLPRNGQRPQTMFDTTSTDLYYMSNPDLLGGGEGQDNESIDFENQRIMDMENLVTINNKTGQKYAMDDTAYETLSRRKKIAGQRLAIGVMDSQTERSFLQSLKRNQQFKHAREECGSDQDIYNRPKLADMVF